MRCSQSTLLITLVRHFGGVCTTFFCESVIGVRIPPTIYSPDISPTVALYKDSTSIKNFVVCEPPAGGAAGQEEQKDPPSVKSFCARFSRSTIDKPAVQQITDKSHHHNKWRNWFPLIHMHTLQYAGIQGQMALFGKLANLKLEVFNPRLLCNALRNFRGECSSLALTSSNLS
jgi:hypothetical protein